MPTSVNLNSARKSHVYEIPDMNHLLSNVSTTLLGNYSISSKEKLYSLSLKDPNMLIFAHLNISSIRNKFYMLADIAKNNIDILMILEAKRNSPFSNGQF